MSFADAVASMSAIDQQLELASSPSALSETGSAASPTSASSGLQTGTDTSATSSTAESAAFAAALIEAQALGSLTSSDGADGSGDASSPLDDLDSTGSLDSTSELISLAGLESSSGSGADTLLNVLESDPSLLSELTGTSIGTGDSTTGTSTSATGLLAGVLSGTTAGSSVSLSSQAKSELTSDQQTFASRLVADTGLNPNVVSAWLLAEENGSAATTRQSQSNNDWLNIGYTDSGTVGAGDSVWSDPTSAADATAAWLKGQDSVAGYGTASSGIQAIMDTVGQSPEAQISAIRNSGWASSGYPELASLYTQVSGATFV